MAKGVEMQMENAMNHRWMKLFIYALIAAIFGMVIYLVATKSDTDDSEATKKITELEEVAAAVAIAAAEAKAAEEEAEKKRAEATTAREEAEADPGDAAKEAAAEAAEAAAAEAEAKAKAANDALYEDAEGGKKK